MLPPVDDIRRRMAEVRAKGFADANRLDHAVERLKDWREHVKSHPWMATGLTALAAYVIVPQRHAAAPAMDAETSRDRRIKGEQNDSSPTEKAAGIAISGVISGVVAQFAKNAIRNWATNELRRRFHSSPSAKVPPDYSPTRQR